MTLVDWLVETRRNVKQDGWRGVKDSSYKFYVGMLRNVGRRYNFGEPIFEADWDLLVVLDACRWDLMAEVVDDYDFVDTETTYSIGSSSAEWMEKNFGDQYATELSETAYVTANPYSDRLLDTADFAHLDEVWKDRWDDDIRTIPASGVTDRAIAAGRQRNDRRTIVHYMQPHHPFVPEPMDRGIPRNEFSSTPWDNVWHKLRRGEVDRSEVWRGYRRNLEYVLDSVATLLDNFEAETAVITADHGNLLGEYGVYAHPDYVPIRALKRVPWCVTTARDTGTYDPGTGVDDVTEDTSVADRLRHLGYTE